MRPRPALFRWAVPASGLAVALLLGLCGALVLTAAPTPIGAQQWRENIQGAAGEWNVTLMRPKGMPVIPMFEGWIDNGDGTANLCFGFYNLNLEEALEIPVGPDNYIEPERYDGVQPTYFGEVPTYDHRYYCVFTINVPVDSEERIVWHLRRNDQDYQVPGHTQSDEYTMYDLFFPSDRGDVGGAMAPIVSFVDPAGPSGIGKGARGNIRVGPVGAKVGVPLTLTLGIQQPDPREYPEVAPYRGPPKAWEVFWWKHSGPATGRVVFGEDIAEVAAGEPTSTTTATFSEPGRYVLRTTVRNEGPGGFGFSQCCWTTGYVEVNVSR